ncbi:hypothetical protein NX059_005119 [Plenodomus lindquistii]|nr:hypothetical protein NX059_005119 [Plenodomus lindquistii]
MVNVKNLLFAASALISGIVAAPLSAGSVEARAIPASEQVDLRHGLERRVLSDTQASDLNNILENDWVYGSRARRESSISVTNLSGCTVLVFWASDWAPSAFHILCGNERSDAKAAYEKIRTQGKRIGQDLEENGVTIAYYKQEYLDEAIAGLQEVNPNVNIINRQPYSLSTTAGQKVKFTINKGSNVLNQGLAPSQGESQTKIRSISNLERRVLNSGQAKDLQDIRENQWVYGTTVRSKGGSVKVTDLSGCSVLVFWADDYAPSVFHILCGEGARADAKKAYEYVKAWGEEFDEDLMKEGITIAYELGQEQYLQAVEDGLKDAGLNRDTMKQTYDYEQVKRDYPGERVTLSTTPGSTFLTPGHAVGGSNQPSKM